MSEYILALLTLTFGFIAGRIYGSASVRSLELTLMRAVQKGEEVIIAIGNKAVRTRIVDNKVVTEHISLSIEIKEDSDDVS
jgi:hypothetical protein